MKNVKYNFNLDECEQMNLIGENINAIVMSHNTEWVPFLMCVKDKLLKFHLDIHGSSLIYLEESGVSYDLVLLHSNGFYQEQELINLMNKSTEISLSNKKRVVFGYASFIPYENRTDSVYDIKVGILENGVLIDNYNVILDDSKIKAINVLYMMYEFYIKKPNIKHKRKVLI